MDELIRLLNEGGYSCVVRHGDETRTFSRRGVADLSDLYRTDRDFLQGAWLADKVVGKGAAALMVLGGVARMWTRVISTPALSLLRNGGVEVAFAEEVPCIINRTRTGRCPLETLCDMSDNPAALYPVIEGFVSRMREAAEKENTNVEK